MTTIKGQVFADADLPSKSTGDVIAISLNTDGSVRVGGAITIAADQAPVSPTIFAGLLTDGYDQVAGPCDFYGLVVTNQTAGALYCQVHDSADSPPANGTVPKLSLLVGANEQVVFNFGTASMLPVVMAMATGLTIASSSTSATLTLGASDSLFVTALYKV